MQTFTSYKFRNNGEPLIRGFSGNTYYLTNTGFHPSLLPQYRYSPCWSDNITGIGDFRNMNCSIPMMVDGRTYHSVIAVNDRIPGPTLIVTEEQKVVVDVENRLAGEGVTIHWHGLHQRGTPWMDGVAFLSQAPITPGSVFRYSFTASPAGTHWYHSHVGTQRTDGLFGSLVVREKFGTRLKTKCKIGDFEDIPELHTITLFDFQREPSLSAYVKVKSILPFYFKKPLEDVPKQTDSFTLTMRSSDSSSLGPIPFWSGLINGRGRYDSTTYSMLSVFDVDVGKAYRFRVVGAQALFAYKLEIVGHKVKVVASDGQFFVPVEVDYIIVHTGERYDFILTADQNPENYLIRAQVLGVANLSCESSDCEFLNHTAEAILHYNDASVPQPNPLTLYNDVIDANRDCSPTHRCKAINCPFKEFPVELDIDCISLNGLKALFPSKESDMPDLRTLLYDNSVLFLNFGFDGNIADPSVNGRTFQLPPTPYQTYPGQFEEDRQSYPLETCQQCHVVNKTTHNCDCTYVIQIAKDKVHKKDNNNGHIIMIFSAVTLESGKEFHPIHLHGHSFHVVHVEYGSYENGILQSSSEHISCGIRCLDPKWNGTAPDFSKYMTSSGKLNETAILKDTVIVPAGGYVVVAVQLSNPGYWFLHCHAEPHLFKGMAVVLQEYSEDQHPLPPYGINKVGHFLGTQERPSENNCNRWMIGCIAASMLAAVALIVVIAQSIVITRIKSASASVCCSLQRKNSTVYNVFNDQCTSEEMSDMDFSVDVH